MDVLITANIAYLLIVAAFLLLLISILVPGSGVPETSFLACLAAGIYLAYQIGINLWAVAILLLSIALFVIALRQKILRIPMLVASIVCLIGGSIFLFTTSNGFPLVNPIVAVIVSVGSGGFIWLSANRAASVLHQAPTHNIDSLIGQVGLARTHIHAEGSVLIGGELWSARSETPIQAKKEVRIIRRDGLILTVEEQQSK